MIDSPGLRQRRRRDTIAYYWVAVAASRRAKDYPTRTVRLHDSTPEGRAQRCRQLTAELEKWLRDTGTDLPTKFGGRFRDLIRSYQHSDDSAYRDVKHSTRGDYDYNLRLLDDAIGGCLIVGRTRADVMRWYRAFRAPATDGEPERIRRAHGAMTMLRIIAKYGRGMRYPGCADLKDILGDMQFEQPRARDEAMTFEQARAVVLRSIETDRLSIALAQALQFECSLRQVDAVGYWEPAGGEQSGIVERGARWTGGVTWSDVSPSLVLKKRTTKTAARGEWDLTRCPLVMMVLPLIPPEKRVGPMIVFERTGMPYRQGRFGREWRKVARAVGIPDNVHNRDSRAGGITEGDLAGAEPGDLQKLATHSDVRTTSRYIRSTTRKATDNVAELRVRAREK